MAVEDGAVIGKLLGLLLVHHLDPRNSGSDPSILMRPSARDLTAAVLTLYEKCRKARTTRNVQGAVMNRKLFHIPDGFLQRIRDFLLGYAGVTWKSDWTWLSSLRQGQTLGLDVLEDCRKVFEEWRVTL
jgi:salicylate hydroxylase